MIFLLDIDELQFYVCMTSQFSALAEGKYCVWELFTWRLVSGNYSAWDFCILLLKALQLDWQHNIPQSSQIPQTSGEITCVSFSTPLVISTCDKTLCVLLWEVSLSNVLLHHRLTRKDGTGVRYRPIRLWRKISGRLSAAQSSIHRL